MNFVSRYILSRVETSTQEFVCDDCILEDILEAANYLQMTDLVNILSDRIIIHLNVSTCWKFKVLASQLYIPQLENAVFKYICKHLETFSETDEFGFLSAEDISYIFQDDEISLEESNVFGCLLKWLTIDSSRMHDAQEIISLIRFGLMTSEELKYWNVRLKDDFDMELYEKCNPFLTGALKCEHNIFHFHNLPASQKRPRNSSPFLLAIGGFTRNEYSTNRISYLQMDELRHKIKFDSDIEKIDEKENKFNKDIENHTRKTRHSGDTDKIEFHQKHVNFKLPQSLCEHCVCVLDDFVYVAGGQTKYLQDGRYTTNSVYRYDPRNLKWIQVRFLPTK